MIIQREQYLSRLKLLKDKNLIKVLTGIRRAGKSTLLQLFREELLHSGVAEKNIIFINFEERENIHLTDWKVLHDEIINSVEKGKMNYVFLDEIQMVYHFEKMVDSLFVKKNIDIYITGSNAFLLSGELATLLSGRYISTHILPLSFKEYVEAYPDINKDRLFDQFLMGSGMPETLELGLDTPNLRDDYLRDVYETIVKKDIQSRFKIRNMANFEKVVRFLFDNIGSPVSAKNIADNLNIGNKKKDNISNKTIDKYLEYLTAAYLFYKVNRYDIKGKQLLKTQNKYFAVDLGFRHILLGQKTERDLGHKLENIVFLELRRRNTGHIIVGKTDENEVDFVVQNNSGDRTYYQVALSLKDPQTRERELKPLQKINDHYQKIIITTDFDNSVYEGIQKINVIDWLLS